MRAFDEKSAGQAVRLTLHEEFEIVLPENPTTGFRWKFIEEGAPVCRLVGDEFDAGRAPGAGGIHHWRFRAEQPGAGAIRMALGRSWRSAADPAKSFTLPVSVTS